MPRPVVPIFWSPRRPSRARSSAPCDGRISAALSANRKFCGEMSSPFSRIVSISATSAQGSTTTPLPMIDSLPRRTTPDGSRLSLYSVFPTRRVWPALWPPWKRTTTSARSDNQSTILPLPSSPHWAPTTATLPTSRLLLADRHWPTVLQKMAAAEPIRLCAPVGGPLKRRDGDPAVFAQRTAALRVEVERQQQSPRCSRPWQCLQDRVGVQREPSCRLWCRRVSGIVAAAAPEITNRTVRGDTPGKEREADPRVIFETAVFHGIDRHLERGGGG